MRINLHNVLIFLYILCLGISLAGIVMADDQSGETYGAYPGAPTPVSGQPGAVGAYPSGPTTAYPTQPTPIPTTQPTTIKIGQIAGPASTSPIAAVYSTQAPPAAQQNVLLTYNVQTAPPTAVFYSGTFLPWVTFQQIFPANTPALWVASSAGWSWYATCPVGGWVQNLMYVPFTGTMKLYEFYPDGTIKLYSYGFKSPGYKYIWFYADTPGRHITLFTIFDRPSNYITIDVF